MPPLRTAPVVKPIKTERTHEENQERAYIAASRRSDRSLEARVESARRASEIHKRRTGRSLRVTEQDVVNEEMYEEEDDDLPMQYRRLTAHLQTSNAEFDRRLAAYLTNHVAMRTALGQAVNQNQGYPNAPQFAGQGQGAQMQPQSPFTLQHMGPPQQTRSPTAYRQSLYPLPQHGMKSGMHSRSASIASPNELQNVNKHQFNVDARRSSVPHHAMPGTPGQQDNKQTTSIANLKYEHANNGANSMLSPPTSESGNSQNTTPQAQSQQLKASDFPNPFDMSSNPMANGMGAMPWSTALPLESQQLLGGAFDMNDPMTSMLMGSDFKPNQPFFQYDTKASQNMNDMKVKSEFTPTTTFEGMNQTLAPGFLDTSVGGFGNGTAPNSAFTDASPFANSAGGYGMSFDGAFNNPFKTPSFASGLNSGEVTPANERDWQSMIDGTAWDEQTTT
ncbi:hypothetical protein C1H76_3209 [Elsinoe australis]|uniref:Uncharacterized protein n=1 Tax=Elsinoe australis TaxID=40998 RepID=A0A4U7B5Q3_9PEZI|nr:hypothetical protein C1H76_3209 [Elsinoe australis]